MRSLPLLLVLGGCGPSIDVSPTHCKQTGILDDVGAKSIASVTGRGGGLDVKVENAPFGCERSVQGAVSRRGRDVTVTFDVGFTLTYAKCGDCLYDLQARVGRLPPGTYSVKVVRKGGYIAKDNEVFAGDVTVP